MKRNMRIVVSMVLIASLAFSLFAGGKGRRSSRQEGDQSLELH